MSERGERTEAPTPKRRQESRRKGQVARSAELTTWAGLLAATYVLPLTLGGVQQAVVGAFVSLRQIGADPDPNLAVESLGTALTGALLATVPLVLVVMAIGIGGTLAQTRGLVSPALLVPKFQRISPKANLKRLLSTKGLWETGKQAAKLALITFVAWPKVAAVPRHLVAQGRVPLAPALGMVASDLVSIVRTVAGLALLVAVGDYAVQRRQHLRDLKMTKEEVRQEMRQSEGDPMVKGRIRSLQRERARQRMFADVPTADVVITNPTHVAVALRYDPGVASAPKVVAVGAGAIAARIRAEAAEAGVPMVEAKPLARALWRACDVGDQIPAALFEAVAKVLAFVRRLTGGVASAGPVELPLAFRSDSAALDALPRRRRRR